jgi:tRNA splicing endonuclease
LAISGVLAEIEDDSFVIEEVPLRQWITLLWSDQIPSSAPVALEHPQVELALHRAAVYADLWHRGYYITAARKFGSDFLVYPRPQHQCHAACLVLVRPRNCPDSNTKESDHGGRVPKMTALDLASLTRLASSVKKSLVIASVSPPAGSSFLDRLVAASGQELKQCWADIKPSYLTIDWMQRETTIPSAIRAM